MPTPSGTYRLQLNSKFRFEDAMEIAPYLRDLGVSHVYCSPYLQAAAGSTHGYDVVDHDRVNEEIGGEEGHRLFCDALGHAQLGQVLDIVPNHMAIGTRANAWWWDVLENGRSSRYANYFDVEWHPPESKQLHTVLVPILGDHYGRVLESGELKLAREGGKFIVHYYHHQLPASPRAMGSLLADAAGHCGSDELGFIADTLSSLPDSTESKPESVVRRHRDKEIATRLLAKLCQVDPGVRDAIDNAVSALNADPDALDQILTHQNYRLAYWRTAGRELDYRRFFDIDTLIGLHMEDDRVFADSHRRVLEWLRSGVIDGLRIDHPDGLLDPAAYFDRLRAAAPDAWVVAEKILEGHERLRETWSIAGTTGYDFLNRVNALLVDPRGEKPLTDFYGEFTGETIGFADLVHDRKQQVLRDSLAADVTRLTVLFLGICERHRRHRDHTRHDISQAIRETIACFPIYRTYVQAVHGQISGEDIRYVTRAIDAARTRRPDLPPDLFDFLKSVLLLEISGPIESEFVMRFQQFTGPAMAKGVEDTAFYNYNRLVCLNEVGGDPGTFGLSLEEFHRACHETQSLWPTTMLATSTHDTKRGEDVRTRIALLAEIPEQWKGAVLRWSERHPGCPDRNIEYLFYQTVVGAWPIGADRLLPYMEKCAREAKTHTSWTEPKAPYETALKLFVESTLADPEFEEFVEPLVEPGRINSLSQTLLKLTCPGVPDIYQGTELWDLNLVDPDNRRPVDYQLRTGSDSPKLLVIRTALNLRRNNSHWFGPEAAYHRVDVEGAKRDHVVAFIRAGTCITVVPRWPIRLAGNWEDTQLSLPQGKWQNLFTKKVIEGEVQLSDLLGVFPVALLVKQQ